MPLIIEILCRLEGCIGQLNRKIKVVREPKSLMDMVIPRVSKQRISVTHSGWAILLAIIPPRASSTVLYSNTWDGFATIKPNVKRGWKCMLGL